MGWPFLTVSPCLPQAGHAALGGRRPRQKLVVKQGETVKKGQPIVELDKSVALADLAEKTATRDGLKASLALLKSVPRPEERRANELAIEQAKVALERAKRPRHGSGRCSRGMRSPNSRSSRPTWR